MLLIALIIKYTLFPTPVNIQMFLHENSSALMHTITLTALVILCAYPFL